MPANNAAVTYRKAYRGNWLRVASIAAFFALWQIAATLSADADLLPGPLRVLNSLRDHALHGQLFFHLGMTLQRVAIAFVLAMLAGSAIGILMGRLRWTNSALDGLLVIALNVPALVTIILCYIWLGLNEFAAVAAVAINKIPTVAVTVREGARALDTRLLEVGHVYQISRSRRLRNIILPQLYPYLLAAARSGLALIWKIVLVVELLGRSNGVGFQLGTFFNFFDITSILAYTLAFVLVIFLLEAVLFRPLDRHIGRWRAQ
ncbi:ABC transporter permease [Granulosicoccaceae sp. 1_MG-2023]|nr:ABC transporter permease [Granulosicoccaceae sp. 1_MG-2023]